MNQSLGPRRAARAGSAPRAGTLACSVGSTFAIVLFAVVGVAVVVGLLSLIGRERAYEEIGRETIVRDSAPAAAEPTLADEIRGLVVARNERRARNGEPPLDVEAEVQRQLRELGG